MVYTLGHPIFIDVAIIVSTDGLDFDANISPTIGRNARMQTENVTSENRMHEDQQTHIMVMRVTTPKDDSDDSNGRDEGAVDCNADAYML